MAFDWRLPAILANMKANPVVYCNLIIRSQLEYSATTQAVIVRCMLESPATGQRQGFTDVEALLAALRTELMAMQSQIISLEEEKKNNLPIGS